ncbi:MAG: hypothetical protein NT033_07135, partial [Candidatus Omnitrophica bacterium]|nr:hypothetical protein [Candidatus Omnitrophota bacterium]
MKNADRLNRISKVALLLCLTLTLPQAGLASDPQPKSFDRQRIAHYLAVIKGYLAEAREIISTTGDGGREYITMTLLDASPYAGIGDYVIGNEKTADYRKFTAALDSLKAEDYSSLRVAEDGGLARGLLSDLLQARKL